MTIFSGGQNICGVSIGVLCLDSKFPKPPGHIKNPSGLGFTVLYETVKGATVKQLLSNPTTEFIEPFIQAARFLEAEGVRAITGSCGFLALFQKELCEAVDIPVFASSLVQLPMVYQLTGAKAPVGVLTASQNSLTRKHFDAVGAGDIPVVIKGMEGYREFNEVIIEAQRNQMDVSLIESEVLSAASELYKNNPSIRAIVLECTDMPPYAHQIQKTLGLPVFDLITLATMVHSTILRQPYSGFMPRGEESD
ncbi:MAG: aspartate/glutamate racemase family protein [Gammaproteobacteria bacterium]|nr:aspartate/glutamate racemase family protein [Gammaproteobacteria bacterium]